MDIVEGRHVTHVQCEKCKDYYLEPATTALMGPFGIENNREKLSGIIRQIIENGPGGQPHLIDNEAIHGFLGS